MANPSKARGTQFESAVVKFLRERGAEADKLGLNGNEDQGDIVVREEYGYTLIEAKAGRKYDLAGWMQQALVERENYADARGIDPRSVLPTVVVKRPNKSIGEAFVITTLNEIYPEVDE